MLLSVCIYSFAPFFCYELGSILHSGLETIRVFRCWRLFHSVLSKFDADIWDWRIPLNGHGFVFAYLRLSSGLVSTMTDYMKRWRDD